MAAKASKIDRGAGNLLFTARCESRTMLIFALKTLGNATVPLGIALLAHVAG